MKSNVALGIASNIVHITDFTGKLLSTAEEIRHSTNATSAQYRSLYEAATNLSQLSDDLKVKIKREYRSSTSSHITNGSEDTELLLLSDEARNFSTSIIATLQSGNFDSKHENLENAHLALEGLWERSFPKFEERYEKMRRQMEIGLLFSLRHVCLFLRGVLITML